MSTPTGSAPSLHPDRPTRTRYWVIVFAVTLAFIQYVDRVAISQLMPAISADMKFTDAQKGMIFSAFTLAYALFEIPTGWLGDKIGAKKVLIRVVLWWSFFTAATGWAWNYVSMLVIRFLFGAGEAGCFPNLTKAFSAWLPKRDRTRAQSLMWMGARWGGASAPLLVVLVMTLISWRMAFLVFAGLGVIWAVIFALWFRDKPSEHRAVNAAELALLKENEQNAHGHGDVPWGRLVTKPTIWLLGGQYFFLSYGWYFFVTWLPTYLRDERGMDIRSNVVMQWLGGMLEGAFTPAVANSILAAAMSGLPLLFGGFGALFAGVVSSRLVAGGARVTVVRRSFGFIGLAGAASLLMFSFTLRDPLYAMLAMGCAGFFNDLTLPGSWATCMDVGGKYAGTVSGSMNMLGNFGGMAGPIVVGFVLSATGRDWQLVFIITSVIYSLGALCWLFIDPVTPLEKEEAGVMH